ncbi:MAG TPA: deoxyguanosinetriphosphate triphosphohydrolase [Ignavibacteriales bacterium]|nr:deoxyguanosinetriphosphate triphosphohydrolase [Ignavibacteriales bacterium]
MNWEKLLCKERLYLPAQDEPQSGRSLFQRDFDRIVFSSAFRRLQDKTQVFPLPENDFVHTRLTHSLEVSCVGRSLGNAVGIQLIKRHPELNGRYSSFDFGEITAAACLAHDIGNPPFGHSGEDAISEYFVTGSGQELLVKLDSEKKRKDLSSFEGNAQGFRILTKLQNPTVQGGIQLTFATLASFIKYPKESVVSFRDHDKKNVRNEKLYKKYGFFQSEKEIFLLIADKCGLLENTSVENSICYARHPLAFLVEAADDICYRIMDLEDGYRLGLIPFNETEELLMNIIDKSRLKNYNKREKNDKIGYLRANAIGAAINQTAGVFLDKENEILAGTFNSGLLSEIAAAEALHIIKEISKEKIYAFKPVIEREAAGFEALGGLLDYFIRAVNDKKDKSVSKRSKAILQLLPSQFLGVDGNPEDDLYERILKVTDFVSGMTDSYAISLYRKIKGISLPMFSRI